MLNQSEKVTLPTVIAIDFLVQKPGRNQRVMKEVRYTERRLEQLWH